VKQVIGGVDTIDARIGPAGAPQASSWPPADRHASMSEARPWLRPARGCHPSLGYRLSPMRPGQILNSMVGVAGFEPTTPCPPDKCANRAALHSDGRPYRQPRRRWQCAGGEFTAHASRAFRAPRCSRLLGRSGPRARLGEDPLGLADLLETVMQRREVLHRQNWALSPAPARARRRLAGLCGSRHFERGFDVSLR
jgi:hypothetical protein